MESNNKKSEKPEKNETTQIKHQFKTMNINSQSEPFISNFQTPSQNQHLYTGLSYFLMNLLNDPTVKKFYQNEVLEIPIKKLENYNDVGKIKLIFESSVGMNDINFNLHKIHDAVFYILRSTCDDDIHKAIKYGMWTSTHRNNVMLNEVYKKCKKKGIPLYLFFTVVNSGQFSGVAEMISEVRFNSIFNYWWEELKWSGVFDVNWVFVKDVHHEDVKYIKQDNICITNLRDGSFLNFKEGMELLEFFKTSGYVSDIFEAFVYMDGREEKLRMKRDSFYNYILQLKKKGFIPKFGNNRNGKYNKKNYKNDGYKKRGSNYYTPEDVEYVKKN